MVIRTFNALFKKEIKEQLRTARLIIAFAVFIFAATSAVLLIKFLPDIIKGSLGKNSLNNVQVIIGEQSATDAVASYLNNMAQLPALAIILLAMGTIAHERERGTAILVLTKPVSRTAFVLSKFSAYWLVLAIALLVTAIISLYYILILFPHQTFPLTAYIVLNIDLLAYLSILLALTIFCSSLFRNQIAAGGLAFIVYLVLNTTTGLLPAIQRNFPTIITSAESAKLLHGLAKVEDFLPSIVTGSIFSALLLAAACIVTQAKEM